MSRTPSSAGAEASSIRRAALPAVVGLGVCAAAAVSIHRWGQVAAPALTTGSLSFLGPLVGPVVGVALVLLLLTVVAGVPRTALVLRLAGRPRTAALLGPRWPEAAPDERTGPAPVDALTTLSHEIRAPLNAIMGVSELLMTARLDTVQREQIGQLRRSALLILGLVDDELDRAVVGADQLVMEHQPFELSDLLGDAVELFQVQAAAKGVRLRSELDASCPEWVRGDGPRLRQVLVNLLGNAVKYTDQGVVTLEACRAAAPDGSATVYFQVTDTGTGIPTDQVGRIFEPYGRVLRSDHARPGGAGLGLSISQALVRGMGGEITVTSQPGTGSVFGFEIVLPAEPLPETVGRALWGRRITLLDRQPVRAAQSADHLRRWGAQVEVVLGLHGSTATTDVLVVREDHPDELAHLGAHLRSAQNRPPLLLVTASPHAVPREVLGSDDLVAGPDAAGRRLRTTLISLLAAGTAAGGPTPSRTVERPLRVLLAEDDPTSRQVCEILVRQLGHHVDVVADGAAAVRAALTTAYDVVLMDSQMPELDGVEATRAIRAGESAGRRARVIALTGAVTAADQEAYVSAGMDGLLAKPINKARLAWTLADVPRPQDLSAVRTAVRGREPAPAIPLAG